jgi:hypothetical protein
MPLVCTRERERLRQQRHVANRRRRQPTPYARPITVTSRKLTPRVTCQAGARARTSPASAGASPERSRTGADPLAENKQLRHKKKQPPRWRYRGNPTRSARGFAGPSLGKALAVVWRADLVDGNDVVDHQRRRARASCAATPISAKMCAVEALSVEGLVPSAIACHSGLANG